MEKNNKIVFGIIALVFLLSLLLNGFEDTTGAGTRGRLADLQVAGLTATRTMIILDVKNDGLEDTSPFVIEFSERTAGVDEPWTDIGNKYVDELRGGEQMRIEHEWNQRIGGQREIKVVLDTLKKVREFDEVNNEYTEIVTTESTNPDIFISNIATGLDIITITIENAGKSVTDNFLVKVFKIDTYSTEIHKETINGILNGRSNAKTITFDYRLPSTDDYKITVVADVELKIPEGNEDNNCAYLEKGIVKDCFGKRS